MALHRLSIAEATAGERGSYSFPGLSDYGYKLDELLREAVKRGAADLHINAGHVPYAKINGGMVALKDYPQLDKEVVRNMLRSCMTEDQYARFMETLDMDFSYNLPGHANFRVNALFEKNYLGGIFRVIPERPMSLEKLGVPEVMKNICLKKQGLVLVTGRTGNGKTSTMAGALQHMNETRDANIITIEDPIEFDFENENCFIRQREVGQHTRSFASGLKFALRQNPDVIMVGEMRDMETIATVLTAAETGHLVFSTLHTFGAVETINRIIDPFPPDQQQQIRMQLSSTLEAIFAQCLVPRTGSEGVVLCCEILLTNPAIKNIIREGKTHHLRHVVESSANEGMVSMERALVSLCAEKAISYEDALPFAVDPGHFRDLCTMHGIR